MVKYIEGNVNLSDREGREKAIEFAKSMNNYEKRTDLKDYIVDDLFRILRSNINLMTINYFLYATYWKVTNFYNP